MYMNREQYVKLREENSIEIMYEYYKENFKPEKHSPLLNIEEFIQFMKLWPNRNEAHNVAVDYYDAKYNILKCPTENGVIFI